MKYKVRIVHTAEREMDNLPAVIHTRISRRILSLEDDPRPKGVKKLSGREEYRLRVGDYRILYTVDDKDTIVIICAVSHRREAYH